MKLLKPLVLISSIGLALVYILFSSGTFNNIPLINSKIQLSPNVGGINLTLQDTIRNDSLKFVSKEKSMNGLIYIDSLGNRYYDKEAWLVTISTSKSAILSEQVDIIIVNDSVYYRKNSLTLEEALKLREEEKDSTHQKK